MNRKNTKALTLLLSLTILFSVLLSGCGETKNGDMQKVVLNEVAHSIEYPDKNNIFIRVSIN